jgi:carbohydrate kinase (thermoresistant glucokinase family)
MVIVLMGPAGSGKSTVGAALAASLGWRFLDADTLHSAENIARIRRGDALSDRERAPWLRAVAFEIAQASGREPLVVACSALRKRYRQTLRPHGKASDAVRFVYLDVSAAELARRLQMRATHFATAAILPTQLRTWEKPDADEHDAVRVDGEQPPAEVIAAIRRALRV